MSLRNDVLEFLATQPDGRVEGHNVLALIRDNVNTEGYNPNTLSVTLGQLRNAGFIETTVQGKRTLSVQLTAAAGKPFPKKVDVLQEAVTGLVDEVTELQKLLKSIRRAPTVNLTDKQRKAITASIRRSNKVKSLVNA